MSQFTLVVLLLIAGWLAYRQLQRRSLGAKAGQQRTREATPLEQDPATGVYRPVERKEPSGSRLP